MRDIRKVAKVAKLAVGVPLVLLGVGASSSGNPFLNNPNIFVDLSKKIVPSVVNISALSKAQTPFNGGQEEAFRKFFEYFFRGGPRGQEGDDDGEGDEAPPPGKPGSLPSALGTGFIIDESGLILTNNHVVAEADEIKIYFTEDSDEEPTAGEVAGRDPELDLALIRVKTTRKLKPVEFGDSDKLEVGEFVMAVGNPIGHGHTVTHGIISAKGRQAPRPLLARYLQTDTPINPGNSGGPLVNLSGEVIGINNAIDARAQGIGFAIPINLVKNILPELKKKGVVSRGYIGVLVNDMTPEVAEKLGIPKTVRSPFVAHAYPGEPADQAGIKTYDVVLEFNGRKIKEPTDLVEAVVEVPVGQKVAMKILRAGKEKELSIQIGQRPSNSNKVGRGSRPSRPQKDRNGTGLNLEELNPALAERFGWPSATKGVVVTFLAHGGPAAKTELVLGDVILEVDRKEIRSVRQFFSIVKEKKSYLLRIKRINPTGVPDFKVIVLDLKTTS
ncbi:MAG: trypsin-like peptidase domain-containing protein [Bacteriovoracia bacterium]